MTSTRFVSGRRYRITFLPSGARTKTKTVEVNYLGQVDWQPGVLEFDHRPVTPFVDSIHRDMIREAVDIGPAIWDRS